ncbi:MAG: selenide, water dikinase SelD [Eubacteriales bacterium]
MKNIICQSGGCTAKLGAGVLSKILSHISTPIQDEKLLLGFQSSDDAAIYQITEDIATIQTVDFFPPMVEDPYTFGKIAAANALSDVYAMGGVVKTALNLVCFPEKMNLDLLAPVLEGGAEKVAEAGGSLVGGHSIYDDELKYGLSVMGLVHPQKYYRNNTGQEGDHLVLTKKLGTGIITTANTMGEASEIAFQEALSSMETLNQKTAMISHKYQIHACTDVTGFGFLGHLHEMMGGKLSCKITESSIPVLPFALDYANQFLLTAGGQRNRNFLEEFIHFQKTSFAMEEILFDPQTSGGLLLALSEKESAVFVKHLQEEGISASIVGEITKKQEKEILIRE